MRRAIRAAAAALALSSPAAACDASDNIPGAGDSTFLLAEGDSITFGTGSTEGNISYVPRSCVPQRSRIETMVNAVPGATLGSAADLPGMNSLYGRMLQDNAILAGKKGDRIAILSILIGRNDLVGYRGGPEAYAGDLARYIHKMRQAGWDRVIVGTLVPSTWPGFASVRNRLNTILKTPDWSAEHGVDAIADFAGLLEIGSDKAAARTDLFADGTHPTDKGYAAMAPAYDAALKAVIAR